MSIWTPSNSALIPKVLKTSPYYSIYKSKEAPSKSYETLRRRTANNVLELGFLLENCKSFRATSFDNLKIKSWNLRDRLKYKNETQAQVQYLLDLILENIL